MADSQSTFKRALGGSINEAIGRKTNEWKMAAEMSKYRPMDSRAYNGDGVPGALGPSPARSVQENTVNETTYEAPTFSGEPFEGNKYTPDMLNYPDGVQNALDLQHFVTFYINIRSKSKFVDNPLYGASSEEGFRTSGSQNRINRAETGQNLETATKSVLPAVVGYKVARAGASLTAEVSGSKIIGGLTGVAAGLATGGGVAAILDNAFGGAFVPDTTVRTKTVINLAINDRPSVRYGVDYQTTDLGVAAGIAQSTGSLADLGSLATNAEFQRSLLLNLAAIPSAIASLFGGNTDLAGMYSLSTGTTPNPFREQLFKAVDPRTFQFEYKFLPRSAAEAKTVRDIIQQFKFHMHPELSSGGMFYIYPSEFNIEYRYKDQENMNINRISTCVLENMQVDYGGQQAGFHTFEDGMPTEIHMRLQFKELEILTKDRIDLGY
jgi:hypothetical protein